LNDWENGSDNGSVNTKSDKSNSKIQYKKEANLDNSKNFASHSDLFHKEKSSDLQLYSMANFGIEKKSSIVTSKKPSLVSDKKPSFGSRQQNSQ